VNDDQADNETDSLLTGVVLPEDGDYLIQVNDLANSEVGGGYTLVIKPAQTATATPELTAEATPESTPAS
jgi:hypothetical protein